MKRITIPSLLYLPAILSAAMVIIHANRAGELLAAATAQSDLEGRAAISLKSLLERLSFSWYRGASETLGDIEFLKQLAQAEGHAAGCWSLAFRWHC